jgi:predicted O-methyltransferase YrrM
MANKDHRITDIRANANPLTFVEALVGNKIPIPNFAETLGMTNNFERLGTPKWSSESSVSEFLGELVFRLHARTVVELGCFIGWTSAHLALGLREAGMKGKLWCVDSEARFLEDARANLARLELDQLVTFLCGQSTDEALLANLPSVIDVVFIDTGHSYETTRKEIVTYAQRLNPGGCIILHDSIGFPGVRRAVAEVWDQFHSLTFATERSNGVTVLWSKR